MKSVPLAEFMQALKEQGRKAEVLPEGVTFQEDVVYGHGPGTELKLDLFDRKARGSGPRPAIVFIHGGGWSAGDKTQFHVQCAYLAAQHGMLAVSIKYRLSQEAPFPAAVQDCKCALRWVRAHAAEFGVDPKRVAVAGSSAGGHLAGMVALTPGVAEFEGAGGHAQASSHADAAVLINAVLDFESRARSEFASERVLQFLGGAYKDIPQVYRRASPTRYVGPQSPPALILHGADDETVKSSQAVDLRDAYFRANAHAEIEIYPGVGHGWFNAAPHTWTTLQRIEQFLAATFKLPLTAPLPKLRTYAKT
ncbi:MAG: alpha/beta hydrolase [Planctomycetes bacterium]|nr:alpha/beta hydrolase [Planctomycetota bacterium]